jgi:alanine dehydrogenase
VPGVLGGRICIVGEGVAGGAAARLVMGMEATVTH